MSPNPGNRREPPNFSRMVEQYKKELMQYQHLQPQSPQKSAPGPSKAAPSSEAAPVSRQQRPPSPAPSVPAQQPAASSPPQGTPRPAPSAACHRPAAGPAASFGSRPLLLPRSRPPPPLFSSRLPSQPEQREQASGSPPQKGSRPLGWARAMEAGEKCLPPPRFLPLIGRISSWT